jgi:hypothetical protein
MPDGTNLSRDEYELHRIALEHWRREGDSPFTWRGRTYDVLADGRFRLEIYDDEAMLHCVGTIGINGRR